MRGQVRETAYHLTNRDQVGLVVPDTGIALLPAFRQNERLAAIAADHTREIAQVEGRIGTELGRVFSFPFLGLDRIRHSIEPEIQYLFVPQVGRETIELPLR